MSRLIGLAGAIAVAVFGAWLAVSSTRGGSTPPADRHRASDDAASNDGSKRTAPASRSPSKTPRSRLSAGHIPASGPAIARLQIPAIGLEAPLIELGLNADGTLQVPADSSETGLWSGGSFPGGRGPAVIAGHVDSRDGPAVFFRLRELEAGDEVRVTRRGKPARFVVASKELARKDRFPTRRVYGPTPEPTLRLITCTGDFDEQRGHYSDNLIVFAG